MAEPGALRTASFLARLAGRFGIGAAPAPAPALAMPGPKRLLPAPGGTSETRVTGWNAGLPVPLLNKDLISTGAIPLRGEAPSEYQRSGTTVRIKGFEQHPVVQACVRVIVDIAAAVPLQAYHKRPSSASGFSDEITVASMREPAQQLVDAPNTFLSAQRYRKFLFAHHLIYGNSFTYLERDPVSPDATFTPPPRSVRIVRPEDVLTVYVNVKGYPLWYLWRDTLGYTHTSPVQDLVHVRDMSVFSFVFGYPRGAAAISDMIGDDEASEFIRQMVTNSGQAGVWLLANEETSPADATAIEAKLHEQFVTRGGRGRIKVMGGIKDVKTVAFSLDQLEFPELRKVARESICSAFGVDPRMIGIATAINDAGLSGVQFVEARRRLLKHTVLPIMMDIESELNLWLSPEFGGDVYYRFDPVALAQMLEDEQATSTRVIAEVGAGLRTIEEARDAIELPPEFDQTHLLATDKTITPVLIALQPAPAVVLDANGNPIPPTPTAPVAPGEGDTPPADKIEEPEDAGSQSAPGKGSTEKDLQDVANKDPNSPGRQPPTSGNKDPEPKARSVRRTWPAGVPLQRVLTRGVVLSTEQKTMLWRQFDKRAAKEEAAYRRTALILFGEERSTVGQIMGQAATAGTDDPASQASLLAMDRAQKEIRLFYRTNGPARTRWHDRFHPLIAQTYLKGAANVATSVKTARSAWATGFRGPTGTEEAPVDFTLENAAVQAAIRDRAARLAEFVGKTTAQAVTDAISIGRQAGMGITDIARLIDKTAFGSGAGTRSVTIARSETVGALNQGEYDTACYSGVVAGKEWLTEGDDRVRESHMECEQEGVIGLEETFKSNGLRYPGDPSGDAADVINCFLPGTRIQGRVRAAIRSPYSGPAREIVAKSGRRLSVTPNHPVLTAEGLRPAWTLRKGDDLLSDGLQVNADPVSAYTYNHQRPPRIEEIFAALRVGAAARRYHLRSDDLHGDARFVNGDIDIVRADGLLWRDGEAGIAEQFGERRLEEVDAMEAFHHRLRPSYLAFEGVGIAATAIPGAAALALDRSSVGLEERPLHPLGVALPAHLDAALREASQEYAATDPGFVRETLERCARAVAFDEIVEIRDFDFLGHVYDVEVDEPNIVLAGGIASSNCRCTTLLYDSME